MTVYKQRKAVYVQARIEYAGNLRAVEVKYHRRCLQMFIGKQNIHGIEGGMTTHNVGNTDEDNQAAFSALVQWMRNTKKQYTLTELGEKMTSYLPDGVSPYSARHLKRLLVRKFGSNIHVIEMSDKSHIITLDEQVVDILVLRESFTVSDEKPSDDMRKHK